MIDRAYFTKYFEESSLLNGWKVGNKRANLIYNNLNEEGFNNKDLDFALREISGEDIFSFTRFRNFLRTHRSMRVERESFDKQQLEAMRIKALMSQADGSQQCGGGDCGKCNVEYCETVSSAALKAITRIIAGSDSQEEHRLLAEKFRGIGFEKYTGVEPF